MTAGQSDAIFTNQLNPAKAYKPSSELWPIFDSVMPPAYLRPAGMSPAPLDKNSLDSSILFSHLEKYINFYLEFVFFVISVLKLADANFPFILQAFF